MSFDYSLIKEQKVNFEDINKVLKSAYRLAKAARVSVTTDAHAGFTVAYESMLRTTLALMLSKGYRPKIQLGHHKTLVMFATEILGLPFYKITTQYEDIRKKRNRLVYEVEEVSYKETILAIESAKRYFEVVEDKIADDNPQQKLWKPK